jgi:hypothetical protein
MDAVPDRVEGPYEAELERTIQELNRRKAQLEDALHQVSFRSLSPVAVLLRPSAVESDRYGPLCRALGQRFLGDNDQGVPGHD